MKNVFKNIFAIIILGVSFFVFKNQIFKSFLILQDKFFPCTRQISYSIEIFDKNFGISQKDFLDAIKGAEDMWETAIGKDLFFYQENGTGELKINLIYDNRQKITQTLKNIDSFLENNKNSYDDLKKELDVLQNDYQEKKSIYDSKIITLRDSMGRYTEKSILEINRLQTELNSKVEQINLLINKLNESASSFNNQIEYYNTVGDDLGEEFEEGVYHSDKNGKKIEIYQFENEGKLKRVLMHELGHALSLDHIDNPKAIMYRLNNGINLIPTKDDINALKAHCGFIENK